MPRGLVVVPVALLFGGIFYHHLVFVFVIVILVNFGGGSGTA